MGDIKTPYGPKKDVLYADPGYRDNQARYPIDTEAHIRAAWAYINVAKNAAEYTAEQLKAIKGRIEAAAKEHGIEISEEAKEMSATVIYPQASLLAAAGPVAPPAAWFSNPQLDRPTRMTVTPEGQVYGHLAQWKVCHVGIGDACVIAPKSRTQYQLFKVGAVLTASGEQVPVGKITLGVAHAHPQYGVVPARDHYDNSGWAAAIVNVGEDQFGIWVHGALTAGMTPERTAELRASALSGDWRRVNGNLELIAALAVNSPGFPIYQEQNGHAFSLVAVGALETDDQGTGEFAMGAEEPVVAETVEEDLTEEQQDRLARLAQIEEEWDEDQQEQRASLLAAIDSNQDDTGGAPVGSEQYNAAWIHRQRSGQAVMVEDDEE